MRPVHYFYNVTTSDVNYGSTPSNVLSVDRLLSNKPCWQKSCESVILKKKTLIQNYSFDRQDTRYTVAQERLNDLQKEGFNIYVYQDGEFHVPKLKVTYLDLDKPIPIESTPIHDKTIIQYAVKQLNLSHDEILILNHQEMNQLMAGDDDDWQKLPSFQQANLSLSNINGVSLRRFLFEKSDEIEELNLSGCINLQNASFDGLEMSKLRSLDLSYILLRPSVNLPIAAINQLIAAGKNTLESIKLPHSMINDSVLQALEEIKSLKSLTLNLFFSDISINNLDKILKKATSLETLKLSSCNNLIGDLLEDLNLSLLKSLDLSYSNISDNNLDKILKKATSLETLKLSSCNNLIGDLLEDLNLSLLKSLDLSYSNISDNNLDKILKKATSLETLKLSSCNNLTGDLLDNLNLSLLKSLNLSDSNISSVIIQKLKASNPGVKIDYYASLGSNLNDKAPSPKQGLGTRASEQSLDADTNPSSGPGRLQVQRVFYPGMGAPQPDITLYRLQAFNSFSINDTPCHVNSAFNLKNASPDLELEKRNIPSSKEDLFKRLNKLPKIPYEYYGKHTILLTSEWQPLPSLSPNERMTEYHLSRETAVDIHYSKRDNFYYIRSTPGSTPPRDPISIDFIIEISTSTPKATYGSWLIPAIALCLPITGAADIENTTKASLMFSLSSFLAVAMRPMLSTKTNKLPDDIQDKINAYHTFQSYPLNINTTHPTGQDFLNALNEQRVGACRHRSFLFKVWMHEHHADIPVRIINNDIHSFVEIKYNNQWQMYNLGGYPCNITITEPDSLPELASSQPTVVELTANGKTTAKTEKQYFLPIHHEKKTYKTTEYIHLLLSNNKPATLIKMDNPSHIAGLRYHLQKQCKNISRPCFYIHSPEDLICFAPYIKLTEENTGTLEKGPGGKLYDFLTAHSQDGSKPLLIVNYDRFTPSEIVRFNALLDTERQADGTDLPKDAQVIGLINPAAPGAYDGADFYSRFDLRETCPLSEEQLQIPAVINQSKICNEETQRIELYGGSAWEEQLLGYWSLDGHSLRFNEGALMHAFNAGKTHLDLSNAPWSNPVFECFWQTALLNGYIQIQGKTIQLPENLIISKSQGYVFDNPQTIISNTDAPTPAYVLNPSLMTHLFGEYRCEKGAIYRTKGVIETHAGNTLSLYVSHGLNDAAWSRILDACHLHNVQLSLTLAQGVALPKELNIENICTSVPSIERWCATIEDANQTAYICSTDVDVTLASLTTTFDLIIDISEVAPADLLLKINATFDDKTLTFHFDEKIGALRQALQENKNVLLKGRFSEEMQHALSEVLYQRQHDITLTSKLILVGTEPHLFTSIPTFLHDITLEDKKRALPDNYHLDDELINTRPLAELNAITRYPSWQVSQDVTLPWKGMETSPIISMEKLASIDLFNAEKIARVFNKQRVDAIERVLGSSPFVFIAGMSGVGKTSFVKNNWAQTPDETRPKSRLYIGKNHIKTWANDKTLGIKTLFIDEANISSRQWSEFEGLFNKPPAILVDNEYVTLTQEHKVIFAGNPLSYGGERQMPSFFKRHGNSVMFEPMPPEYIYHEILKPALSLSNRPEEIALPILKIADFLTSCSQDNILITPRELVSMALFTQCYCSKNPDADPTVVAQFYAYNLSKNLVPDAYKREFEKKFNVTEHLNRTFPNLLNADFLSTKSNQPAQEVLDDFLTLRTFRQFHAVNPVQQYGGLGGLIFEGEPGIGKTELIAKTLVAYGLKKGNLSNEGIQQNVFYIIPISTTLPQKKELLLKAFHEGAVVVMDEINSAPMMEDLLNDLLMGQTPDGKPAKNPGFLLIGTQNPVTMAGRAKASFALQRRMQTVNIPDYNFDEMVEILKHKGLPEKTAQKMVIEYLDCRQEANKNPELYKLCFRDLLKRGEQALHAREVGALQKEIITLDSNATNEPDSSEDLKSELVLEQVECSNRQKFKDYRKMNHEHRENSSQPTPDTNRPSFK